ncbi:MobH family relaxase [Acidithiobacillus caldus]|uniref:Uncharacterized domain-containing protein n=1 Tax=Acidithiobacillus caldus TaxID=33059 RepID=A0A1E7YV12_9PROT|nr:MobH family relaxase [Acidithiobacillus caldus]OFC35990.1 hypothetical protein BAE27_06770 [Acidithiobacillus caldus]OFC38352.1 hypothetical protein BAE28_05740 [Acidithiobacillus caldus]OFC40380.1 hypothetical protein BAE29_05355 [Acidithiobacillus caldus]OFC58927.1 hypothetical protein BAE30_08710 [Acidithiobacillus caldus]
MQKLWSDRLVDKARRLQAQWFGHGSASRPTTSQADGQNTPAGTRQAPKPFPESPIPESWKQQVCTDVPVYPPFRQGLPLLPVSAILQSQCALIREIYGATGVRPDFWKAIYLPVIHAYAHFVHLLPASEGNHHRGAGGLFRHGLEASLYAVRLTDGQNSLEKSAHLLHPTERRRQEDALRLATFCAALLHDIGKPIVDMQVYDQDSGAIWNAALYPSIPEWGTEYGVRYYNIRWRDRRMNRHKNLGIAAAPHLLTKPVMAFLSDIDPYWVETVLRSISGDEMGVNKVRDFATYGDRESVRFDLKQQGGEGNDIGIPVERYLLDAMRSLIRAGTWTVNQSGALVWTTTIPEENIAREIPVGTPVLALLWPKCGSDVIAALHQQGTPGIPKDPMVVADMLLDRELAIPSRVESEGQQRIPFWYLASEQSASGLGDGDLAGQRVLVLRHPEYLLDVVPPLSLRNLYSMKTAAASLTPGLSAGDKKPAAAPGKTAATTASKPAPTPPAKTSSTSTPKVPATQREPDTKSTPTPQRAAPDPQPAQEAENAKDQPHAEPLSVGLRVLRNILMETLLRRRDAQILVPIAEDCAYLKFPEAFKDLGMKPIEILSILHQEHLLVTAPEQPDKLVQKQLLPGQKTEQNVVVLSPLALQKVPCLRLSTALFPETTRRTYHQYLIDHAKACPEGTFSVEKNGTQGYWFLPLEWVLRQLTSHFRDDDCPERFLRSCTIGPGSGKHGGLVVRLSTTPE